MGCAPILLTIFNRPELTAKSLSAIRVVAPSNLWVAADGPRFNHPEDIEKCSAARKCVLDGVDWDCKLHTLFRKENMGCGHAMANAIDWFFSEVEEGIILEDDCIASSDFFRFCMELLDKYRDMPNIMHISGNKFTACIAQNSDYTFSIIPASWGWATWRRAWNYFDFDMKDFPRFRDSGKIKELFPLNPDVQQRFLEIYSAIYNKSPYFSAWDIQWMFACMNNNGLCVSPNNNLVTNIGVDATHQMIEEAMNLPSLSLPEVLRHPQNYERNVNDELEYYRRIFALPPLWKRIYNKLRRVSNGLFALCKSKRCLF